MFQNYIVSAFRNSVKNPIFSLINIGGLAIGLAVCILVYLFAVREFNFDSWAGDTENIYRVEIYYNSPESGTGYMTSMPVPLRAEIANKVPEISRTSFYLDSFLTLKHDETVFYERVASVNPDFLEMFNIEFILGQRENALPNFNSIILSETLAEKYFGSENPIGQTVVLDTNQEMLVTGVYKDIPKESHMILNAMTFIDPTKWYWYESWSSNAPLLYVEVPNSSQFPAIEAQFKAMVETHKPFMDEKEENPTNKIKFFLQKFSDIHLKSEGRTEANPNGNQTALYGYIFIALLILVISCINYINLSTARASQRIKEVCIRKVLGAGRKSLTMQFMGETFSFAVVAVLLALVIVELILPFFTQIVGGELSLNLTTDFDLWAMLLLLVILMAGIAGGYPALYISKFSPSKFLHSNKSEAGASSRLRNFLVVFQFIVASALICMSTIVYSQMNYVNNYNLGFEKSGLLVMRGVNGPITKLSIRAVESEIERLNGVESVSRAYNVPTDGRTSTRTAVLEGTNPDTAPSLRIMPSSMNYLQTLKVPLLAGRYLNPNVSRDFMETEAQNIEGKRDELNAVITRSSASKLGLPSPEAAIGKTIEMSINSVAGATYTIVGVVEDFLYDSAANKEIENLIFYHYEPMFDQMLVRFNPEQQAQVVEGIEQIWKGFYPDVPTRILYIDERLDQRLDSHKSRGQLFLSASLIAIFVSALGLLGLAIFMAEKRTKEIGLRKVMGARVRDIVQLLSWQFSKPILLANAIALPMAWYFANNWLTGFTQRIELSVGYFAIAAVLTIFIGWFTVAGHAMRVARRNPITALRVE